MRFKSVLVSAAGGSVVAIGSAVHASVNFTGTAYTQNFDSLPLSPLNTSLQSTVPWTDDTTSASNRTSIVGWYLWHDLSPAEGGANGHQRFRAGDGSSATGSFYSFGREATNPVTDRALGVLATNVLANEVGSASNTGIYFGVRLTNATGSTLDNFSFTYSGEQWRGLQVNNLTQEFESLTVDYSLTATTIKGTAGPYTNLPGATFTGPNGGWDTGGRLDGNSTDPSSSAGQNKITGLGASVTGINWAPGTDLFIRWQALNTASNGAGPLANDHGLAIDDFTFSAVVPPAVQTFYWDTDGSTPGAGGAAPKGKR
jgi:hypothetical protein